MLALILLGVLFQVPQQERQIEELRRMAEMSDQSDFRLAKQRDIQYRKKVLHEQHEDFVRKFNAYLVKYHEGAVATKEIRDCVRAWEKLRSNPDAGFSHAKH